MKIKGKYNEAIVFTDNIEDSAIEQVKEICNREMFKDSKIRIMPDCHAGAGCVIGTTMTIIDKIVPNLVGVDIGCVDKDTEFLTPDGWKKISEYKGEDIAIYNKESNDTHFSKPLAYIKKEENEFYHLKTKYGIDQMLSKEHTILVERGSHNRPNSRGKLYTITAEELYTKHTKLKLGFRDNFITEIPNLNLKTKSSLTKEQIRVQIMVMADGRIQSGGKCLCQFKRQRKIGRCLQLLDEAQIEYEIKDRKDKDLFAVVFTHPTIEKRISYFKSCSLEQLKVICDEVMKWDGREEDGVFTSIYKEDVDFVQYAFAANGYRTSISYDSRQGKESYRCIVSDSRPRVQIAGVPKTDIKVIKSEDGFKYCFTTQTGFWIMRRNGCICVTGNCGMLTVNLGLVDLNLEEIDYYIRKNIPHGFKINEHPQIDFKEKIENLKCLRDLRKSSKEFNRALGTLGGGNHFIEINKDSAGNKYIVIHSGSRNLGHQVATYYQGRAYEYHNGLNDDFEKDKLELIEKYKEMDRKNEIQKALSELKQKHIKECKIPKDLCYLEGDLMNDYLHDMKIVQEYASLNRLIIAKRIVEECIGIDFYNFSSFQTIHNYIDLEDMILRKGAISAKDGEKVLIPINMRDGSILAYGEGNEEWNYSAPHGGGRTLSRSAAREKLNMEEFKESMQGIYTTSVRESTIDEAPMAYKDIDEIIKNTRDAIGIIDILKPIYNFKSSK